MLKLYIVSSLLAAVAAACCVPHKYESGEGMIMGTVKGGKTQTISGLIGLHYDFDRKMVVLDEMLSVGPKFYKARVIENYNTKTRYIIVDKKCTHQALPTPMFNCIPANSSAFYYYIGTGDKTLDVISYAFPLQQNQISLSVLPDGCVPVGETMIGSAGGVDYMATAGFTNTTLGIKDPSVFNIPSICSKAAYSEEWRPSSILFGI